MLFYNDQDCYLARKHMYTIDIFNTRIQKIQQKDDIINLNDTCDHDSFQTFNSSEYVKVMK